VTFLSGDVHVAAVGRFCSKPVSNLRTDHRFMPQVEEGFLAHVCFMAHLFLEMRLTDHLFGDW
jgi:hypothetical protein